MSGLLPNVPHRVGLFGEFSAGKSTLINSLVGKSVQRTSIEPTTDRVTVIAGPSSLSWPGRVHSVTLDEVPLLRWGVQLWDTPGWNGEVAVHSAEAEWAAATVDEAVYLIDATKGIHRSDRDNLRRLRLALEKRRRPPPLVILGHYDRVTIGSEEEEEELLADAAHDLEVSPAAILRLDARRPDAFDGRRLTERWSTESRERMATALFEAVQSDGQHPLRQIVARGESWRLAVAPEVVLPLTATVLDNWGAHCRAEDERLKVAHRRAAYTYPKASVAASRVVLAETCARWEDSSFGWNAGARVRSRLGEMDSAIAQNARRLLMDKAGHVTVMETLSMLAWGALIGVGLCVGVGSLTAGWGLILAIPLLLGYLALAAAIACLMAVYYAILALSPALARGGRVLLTGIGYVAHGVASAVFAGVAFARLVGGVCYAPFDVKRVAMLREAARREWSESVGLARGQEHLRAVATSGGASTAAPLDWALTLVGAIVVAAAMSAVLL